MSILPFKKKVEKEGVMDDNVLLVNSLREVRTKIKQLTIKKDEILEAMNEARAPDNYLYDFNHNPIAKLTIYPITKFDDKKFKEIHPDLHAQFPKISTGRRWGLI